MVATELLSVAWERGLAGERLLMEGRWIWQRGFSLSGLNYFHGLTPIKVKPAPAAHS